MSQPGYNDIVISNFTAAANPKAKGSYVVVFESFKNQGELRYIEVTEDGAGVPQAIPGCKNFNTKQRIGVTYFGTNDISLFYIGSQSQGEIYQKIRRSGKWEAEAELKVNDRLNLVAGQGSYIACTASGESFTIYYTESNEELSMATGPNSDTFWESDGIRTGKKPLKGRVDGPLVVASGRTDTLLAYTDLKRAPQLICLNHKTETWTPLAQITNAEIGTPLAVNLESDGATAGGFNVFYRKQDDPSSSVSVARRSREAVTKDGLAFSTTDVDSTFAAVTLQHDCRCCTGACKCSRPAQRFFAISKRDGRSTLFQYHKNSNGRWIIPCGLIITNDQFN